MAKILHHNETQTGKATHDDDLARLLINHEKFAICH